MPTNLERAEWAEAALRHFQSTTGADDEDALPDHGLAGPAGPASEVNVGSTPPARATATCITREDLAKAFTGGTPAACHVEVVTSSRTKQELCAEGSRLVSIYSTQSTTVNLRFFRGVGEILRCVVNCGASQHLGGASHRASGTEPRG